MVLLIMDEIEQGERYLIKLCQQGIDYNIRLIRECKRGQQMWSAIYAIFPLTMMCGYLYELNYRWATVFFIMAIGTPAIIWWFDESHIRKLRGWKMHFAERKFRHVKMLKEYLAAKERGFDL